MKSGESWWARVVLRQPPTLADGLASHQDNFKLLRLLAAALVIYGHSYAITGGSGLPELFKAMGAGIYSGTLAVDIFFVISGFMVTGSFIRSPAPFRFARARFFRIVPAYLVCVVLSALVLGGLYTSFSPGEYYVHPRTWSYIWSNMQFGTGLQWDLPGVFTDNPRRSTVNGSLWTLPAEVRMYMWVFVIGIFGLLASRKLANVSLALLFVVGLLAHQKLPGLPIAAWVRLAGLFALGAFAYVNRHAIPASGRILLLLLTGWYALRHTPAFPYIQGLTIAAFVFWFGYRTRARWFDRFGDYSYGTYLWGFPVQQVLAYHAPGLSPLMHTCIALPIVIALGAASWRLIEKPMIALGRSQFWRRRGWWPLWPMRHGAGP